MRRTPGRTTMGWLFAVTVAGLCTTGIVTAPAGAELAVRPVADSTIPAYAPQSGISGGIVVAGSDTMQPIMVKIAAAFKLRQPEVKIAVQGGGSGAALDQFLQDQATIRRGDANPRGHLVSGHVDLLASSRPLTQSERKDFRSRYGFEPTEIPIALDAVAIYVNHQNPIQSLTMDQIDGVFGASRRRGAPEITTWGQLGLGGVWEHQPISLYGRDRRSGTRAFFIHTALLDGEIKSSVKEEPGTALEILSIGRDILGMGYAGIGFQTSGVRILPIAAKPGEAPVLPTAESVAEGTYPLARSLYLYAKRGPNGDLQQEIREFLRFVNSRDGQETIARTGVFPLPNRLVEANLQALAGPPTSASSLTARAR